MFSGPTHAISIADQLTSPTVPRRQQPMRVPLHPNLVHLTIGLFAIAIAFDVAGAFYPLEKRVFRYLALPVTRSGFHQPGLYANFLDERSNIPLGRRATSRPLCSVSGRQCFAPNGYGHLGR